jgi:tRNA (guanine-N7-)-methyltransferase
MHVGGKLAFRSRKKLVSREGLPLVIGGEDPPPLESLVPDGFADLEIEVGSGKGTFVLAASAAKPGSFLIGIEAAPAYAQLAAQRLAEAGRVNALMLVDNAKLYLEDRVPERSLHRVHVYYPDPWPKRRHRKRRFFDDGMPEVLARVLRDDGLLLVATDNACYAGQICQTLGASGKLVRDEQEEQRLSALPPGNAFGPTSFERKYLEEGRILRRSAWRKALSAAKIP